ncbi:MAG: CHAP domain-containing protein [Firmicutes bacterium]|nr:CHAP domain-containing protein [Bacillota bacterium]
MDTMKRKAAAAALLLLAVFAFCRMEAAKVPQLIRTQPPEVGKAGERFYYDSSMNPYFPQFAPYHKTDDGYVTGNCTWYAWGRACELAGEKLPHTFTGDAGSWWEQNQKEKWYPYGKKPKRGAIACYETHAAVVEQEKPLMVSESGWQVDLKKTKIQFNCGRPWRTEGEIRGYIYVGD